MNSYGCICHTVSQINQRTDYESEPFVKYLWYQNHRMKWILLLCLFNLIVILTKNYVSLLIFGSEVYTRTKKGAYIEMI